MYFEIKILEESWVSLQYTLKHTLQPKCVTFRCAKFVFGAIQLKVQGSSQNILIFTKELEFGLKIFFRSKSTQIRFFRSDSLQIKRIIDRFPMVSSTRCLLVRLWPRKPAWLVVSSIRRQFLSGCGLANLPGWLLVAHDPFLSGCGLANLPGWLLVAQDPFLSGCDLSNLPGWLLVAHDPFLSGCGLANLPDWLDNSPQMISKIFLFNTAFSAQLYHVQPTLPLKV